MAKSKQTPGFTQSTKLSTTDISGETHNVKIQQEYIKNQQERNRLYEKEAAQIERINKRLEQGQKATASQLKNLEAIRDQYKTLNDSAEAIHSVLKKQAETVSDIRNNSEKSIDAWSSLSSIYKSQKATLNAINLKQLGLKSIAEEITVKDGLNKKKKEQIIGLIGKMSDGMQSISVETAQLAELSSDDAEKRTLASSRIRESLQLLKDQKEQLVAAGKLTGESLASLTELIDGKENELRIAEEISSQSKLQKEIQEELHETLHGIQKTIHKTKDTVKMLFSGWRGGLSLALFGAGELANHFAHVNKELGVGMTELVGLKTQASLLSMVLGEQAGEAVIDLAKDLGDSHHLTTSMAVDAALLASNYGLSAKQVAFMSTAFGELSGLSYETGKNTGQYVRDLSLANYVAPAQVMKDIADNTEFFALYSKNGGKNIAEAAVAAARLGVGLDTVSKVADHLLDYQSSIQDEMEASVLLGRDLNLGKARELAYQGDIAGAMKAALEASGGIQAYNKMDYYQRQAIAKSLGVSAAEMQQMVGHQETLNGMHGTANKLYSQGSEMLTAMGNSVTGKLLMGMGALIMGVGQLNLGFKAMGTSVGGIVKGTFQIFKNILAMLTPTRLLNGMKAFGGAIANSGIGKKIGGIAGGLKDKVMSGVGSAAKTTSEASKTGSITDTVDKKGGDGAQFKKKAKNISEGVKSFASKDVFIGALGLMATATGLVTMIAGIPGLIAIGLFGKTGGKGLESLGKSFASFGKTMMQNIEFVAIGILALAGMGWALGIFTSALSNLAPVITAIGGVITNMLQVIVSGIPAIISSIGSFITTVLPAFSLEAAAGVLAMAGAFGALGLALGIVGTLGLAALPVLGAVAAIGGAAGMAFGGAKSKDDEMITLLRSIDSKVGGQPAINLDGKKIIEGQTTNSKRQGAGKQ